MGERDGRESLGGKGEKGMGREKGRGGKIWGPAQPPPQCFFPRTAPDYSSPVQPSCTAVNNTPCTFIGLYSSICHFQIGQFGTL